MTGKKLKTFEISGWVQVGVTCEVQAHSLKEAKVEFEKYNRGENSNISSLDWEEGNWESNITLDEEIVEQKKVK